MNSIRRLTCVSGYSHTSIARYPAIWRPIRSMASAFWFDADAYQHAFDELRSKGFRLGEVSRYGDGFYAA